MPFNSIKFHTQKKKSDDEKVSNAHTKIMRKEYLELCGESRIFYFTQKPQNPISTVINVLSDD
jgi:hypothetical protein